MKISQKLILSYILITSMIAAVGFLSINFTNDNLVHLEGEDSIDLANEIGDNLTNDISFRIIESKELVSNRIVLEELSKSNLYFESLSDREFVMEFRDIEWRTNYSEDTDFIQYAINNPSSEKLKNKIDFYDKEYGELIFAEIFITNSYGLNVGQTGKTSDYLQSDEEWWQKAEKNGLHISEFNFDESSGVYSLDISQKITDNSGKFVGVIKSVLNSGEFFNLLSDTKTHLKSEDIEIYLMDKNNSVLFTTSNNPFTEINIDDFSENRYGFHENNSRFISISDELVVDSVIDTGLFIIVEHDPSVVFADADSLIFLISLISTISTIVAIGIGLIISRSIGIPLRILSTSSDKLANGILDEKISVESNDEFRELGRKFENMRLELKSKNDSLKNELQKRSKRLADYKNAIDKHSLVSITDKKGDIIYVNEKFCEVSKYRPEELIGKNHRVLKSEHHPKEFYDGIWSVISKGGVWKGNIKNKSKDGSNYWVKSIIAPLFDDYGEIIEYIAIRTDITVQKLIEDKLATALEEIQKNEKMKDEFSSMVSHELKTPLTPIRGYCELLKLKLAGPVTTKQVEILESVERNVDRLETLIGDVLDSQKLDMKKMKFTNNPFKLNTFMDKIHNDLEPMMSTKQIDLINNSKVNFELNSDEIRLRQVIDNLIRNSTDFVPEKNGIIEFGASEKDDSIKFYVKDNGIGISKENVEKLFTKFYQVDTSARRKHGGTGLGLVICKGIVEGLGGKIWIESEEGKGTTVFFSVPKIVPLVKQT